MVCPALTFKCDFLSLFSLGISSTSSLENCESQDSEVFRLWVLDNAQVNLTKIWRIHSFWMEIASVNHSALRKDLAL